MTVGQAQALASGATSLGDALVRPKTIKEHGQRNRFVDPLRYAWAVVNGSPLPLCLDRWRYYGGGPQPE